MNHKRIDAIDSNKIKRYCTSKEQKNKQAAVWGKNSQNISHTELISRYEIYKELLQVNSKNISKPIKNKRKTLTNRHFKRKIYEWPKRHETAHQRHIKEIYIEITMIPQHIC